MKVGLSTWSMLGLDVYSAVKTIGDTGLDYIELWGEIPHAYPDWVDKVKLRDSLSPYNMALTVHAPFTDLNLATPFEPMRNAVEKALLESLKLSDFLGAKVVTYHPGSVHHQKMIARAIDDSASLVRSLMRQNTGSMKINVENQTRSHSKYHYPIGTTEESVKALLEKTGAGFTLDTGHAHASGLSPLRLMDIAGARLSEIHLSDNSGEADEHLVPGAGSAELDELLGRVSSSDVFVCIEIDPYTYAPPAVAESAIAIKQDLTARAGRAK